MKLYQLKEGEAIQLVAKVAEASAQYSSCVKSSRNGIVFAEAVWIDDKVLNFSGEKVVVNIIYVTQEGKPIVWENCAVQTIQNNSERCYAVYSSKESKGLNRRDAFRQYVGLPGLLTLDGSNKGYQVTVKDISTTGVSFVGTPELDSQSIGDFWISFDDRATKVKVMLSGNAVRDEKVGEDRTVIGCRIKQANINLNTYVASKQNQEIARRRAR